jgi:hypothetical protein
LHKACAEQTSGKSASKASLHPFLKVSSSKAFGGTERISPLSLRIGGSDGDLGNGIAVDSAGNAFVSGFTFDGTYEMQFVFFVSLFSAFIAQAVSRKSSQSQKDRNFEPHMKKNNVLHKKCCFLFYALVNDTL